MKTRGHLFATPFHTAHQIQFGFCSRLCLLVFLFYFSCKSDEDEQGSILKKRQKALLDFAQNYNAIVGWDTLDLDYTVEYKKMFPDTSTYVLIDRPYITDVFPYNEKYFVSCNSFGSHAFYFRLECDRTQVDSMVNNKIPFRISFIAKITSIKKIDLSLTSEYSDAESFEDFPMTRIFIDPMEDFAVEGKVIDLLVQR